MQLVLNNMRKLLLLLIVALSCGISHSYAQKVEVKDDHILADGAEYAQIEKDGCGAFDPQCLYYIADASGKRQLTIKRMDYKDPQVDNALGGQVLYLEFVFLKSGARAETEYPSVLALKAKDIAKLVVKAQLFKNGQLDPEAVDAFVTGHGTPHSDRRAELKAPRTIIIER
jgi:hypothetical protein